MCSRGSEEQREERATWEGIELLVTSDVTKGEVSKKNRGMTLVESGMKGKAKIGVEKI
jgi:hypothetical protein